MCWGILGEVLPSAVHASLSCSAGSALEVATLAGCKMASKSQAIQDKTCVEVCVCVCGRQKMYTVFYISMVFIHRALCAQCICIWISGYSLCLGECLYLLLCQHLHMYMSLCEHAGHPEASRPDVQESGLCRVMSGCLADTADLEQCTQVSPTNELSI